MTEAFPLHWPTGYVRTKFPKRSAFKATFSRSVSDILREIRLLGAKRPIVSTNIPLRRDGLPYSGQAQPKDRGVAVYFVWKEKSMVVACDRWDRIEDNLRAIAKTIEAMRGLERWGVSEMLDRAFTGFAALPAPAASQTWFDVLGVDRGATLDFIEDNYRSKMKIAHPDLGGSHEHTVKLNAAIAEARSLRGAS